MKMKVRKYVVKNMRLFASVCVVVILLTGSVGAVWASDGAVPGDFLYPLDISLESYKRSMTTNPASRAEFEIDVLTERQEELASFDESASQEDIDQAVQQLSDQMELVQLRLRDMNEFSDVDAGEKTRIMTRYEEQLTKNLQAMVQFRSEVNTGIFGSSFEDTVEDVMGEYRKGISVYDDVVVDDTYVPFYGGLEDTTREEKYGSSKGWVDDDGETGNPETGGEKAGQD